MVVALVALAVADLVVGVSNDAVNFLNSALGSKVLSFRTIMIVASIGIFVGCVFSSGMMEVARKGIFNPEMLFFSEIMIIFMAVMITDILLLDFFNTLGNTDPTKTPKLARIIIVLTLIALDPRAEFKKFTASLLTPTIKSPIARTASAMIIIK